MNSDSNQKKLQQLKKSNSPKQIEIRTDEIKTELKPKVSSTIKPNKSLQNKSSTKSIAQSTNLDISQKAKVIDQSTEGDPKLVSSDLDLVTDNDENQPKEPSKQPEAVKSDNKLSIKKGWWLGIIALVMIILLGLTYKFLIYDKQPDKLLADSLIQLSENNKIVIESDIIKAAGSDNQDSFSGYLGKTKLISNINVEDGITVNNLQIHDQSQQKMLDLKIIADWSKQHGYAKLSLGIESLFKLIDNKAVFEDSILSSPSSDPKVVKELLTKLNQEVDNQWYLEDSQEPTNKQLSCYNEQNINQLINSYRDQIVTPISQILAKKFKKIDYNYNGSVLEMTGDNQALADLIVDVKTTLDKNYKKTKLAKCLESDDFSLEPNDGVDSVKEQKEINKRHLDLMLGKNDYKVQIFIANSGRLDKINFLTNRNKINTSTEIKFEQKLDKIEIPKETKSIKKLFNTFSKLYQDAALSKYRLETKDRSREDQYGGMTRTEYNLWILTKEITSYKLSNDGQPPQNKTEWTKYFKNYYLKYDEPEFNHPLKEYEAGMALDKDTYYYQVGKNCDGKTTDQNSVNFRTLDENDKVTCVDA